MKKLTRICVISLLMVLVSTALFAQAETESEAAKPIVLKYGHIWASETRMNKAVLMAAELVKERSNGRLTIEVFPGEQLGSQFEEMENVKQGLQDLTMVYGIDRYCPDFSLFNTPFVFRDEVHQYNVCMNSELTENMVRQYMIDNHGIRLLDMFYHGPRMLTTNADNPVKSPKDVVGLKLRTPDITAWINSWKSIGANVTVFPWGELYLALKQGIVEAQENPLGSINDMKFYEVQKNVILTAHIIDYPFVMINEKKFQSLGPELQKILTDAIHEAHDWVLAEGKKEEAAMVDFFRSEGLNIVEIDKEEWIAAFSETPDMFPNGRAIYEGIQAVK